jgi:SAM-dependent methyltransferase
LVSTLTDPTMLAAARVHAETAGARAKFVQSRIERLPFPDATFDIVVAITILCFIADASEAVSEMRRVLRPTGHLVLGELGLWSLWALTRRFRGWLGAQTWNVAHFRSAGQPRSLVENAGLAVTTIRGAAFYPPIGICARALAPLDPWLGRLTTFCAAFIALSAAPIGKSTPRRGCSAKLTWPQTYT